MVPRTVAVLGGSYGGLGAVKALLKGLPNDWRIVLVDRNSHFNHLYVFPRYTVVSGHEHKAFIPYTGVIPQNSDITSPEGRHLVLHASVTGLDASSVSLSRAFPEVGLTEPKLSYDYLVYALGNHLPEPIDTWNPVNIAAEAYDGTKPQGIQWLKHAQKRVEAAPSVLIVGGGALGIQYATDIKELYPEKHVTILHSRAQLLPRYDPAMHDGILAVMNELGVNVVLGERLDMTSVAPSDLTKSNEHVVRTLSGKELRADLILLCTGQRANSELMAGFLPNSVVRSGSRKGLIRVTKALQVAIPSDDSVGDGSYEGLVAAQPNIFAVGDTADAFGAQQAGHIAHGQGDLAVSNILKLIQDGPGAALNQYTPGPPGIKISLGLSRGLFQRQTGITELKDQPLDWHAPHFWKVLGWPEVKDEDMLQ